MRKHCGNCANYKKETSQFSEECGKCVSARLENGEMTDPSHWRALPQTNADRIRAMSDEELARWMCGGSVSTESACNYCDKNNGEFCNGEKCRGKTDTEIIMEWLKQPAEVDNG